MRTKNPETTVRYAHKYLKMGFSVIPVDTKSKKPLVKWSRYQNERANKEVITDWFHKFQGGGIGIVTGQVSDLVVIDMDSEDGRNALFEYVDPSLAMPICKTPRGWHAYFKGDAGIKNGVQVLKDCDVRATGGYVIAPSGRNGYSWVEGCSIFEKTGIPELPGYLKDILLSAPKKLNPYPSASEGFNSIGSQKVGDLHGKKQSKWSKMVKNESGRAGQILYEGNRQIPVFEMACAFFEGNRKPETIYKYVESIGKLCKPPLTDAEIKERFKSAGEHYASKNTNISQSVRDFVNDSLGWFLVKEVTETVKELDKRLNLVKINATVKQVLSQMAKQGELERSPDRNGLYRKVNKNLNEIDFLSADEERVDICLPFGLHRMVEIMQGNVIIIAGEPNSGKTAFMINCIAHNMNKFEVHYFSSEMGKAELKKRLEKYTDIALEDWKFKAWERSGNFHDVIKPGPGVINIIDFLELYDKFYTMSQLIADIHSRLEGSVALIAIQKNAGRDTGLGGFRSLEKARLYLSLSEGELKISKAKNIIGDKRLEGQTMQYDLKAGCKFNQIGNWKYREVNLINDEKKGKKK